MAKRRQKQRLATLFCIVAPLPRPLPSTPRQTCSLSVRIDEQSTDR
jgi:hypothetical protein